MISKMVNFVAPNYVNSFDHVDTGNAISPPSVDSNVLGNMRFSGDGNAEDVVPFAPDGSGLTVSVTSVPGTPASRTIYLVNDKFIEASLLKAELLFDTPLCRNSAGDEEVTTWAVGLNFKTGDESDKTTDMSLMIGPTCQFKVLGEVHFNGTNANPSIYWHGEYIYYSEYKTQFTLMVSLVRNAVSVEAHASLRIENADIPGALEDEQFEGSIVSRGTTPDNQDLPLENLTQAAGDPQKITAVGVSVVNLAHDSSGIAQTDPTTVSVRLLGFTLLYE